MSQISRRSVAQGIAWSVPAVAVATAAPSSAASPTLPDAWVDCAAAAASITANTASTSFSSTGNQPYTRIPAPNGGTLFSLSAQLNPVPAQPIMGSDGKPTGRMTTGYYIVPGVAATSCVNGKGYTLPIVTTDVYDGNGEQHNGLITAATPAGCSPLVANTGASMNWQVQTDILYTANNCDPNPMNILKQISLPFTIIYLDDLTPVLSTAGTGCSHYINMAFEPTKGCTGTRTAASFTVTDGQASGPADSNFPPQIRSISRTADGNSNGSWCTAKNSYDIYGSQFTGTTSVTWNGKAQTFEVIDDNHIRVTFARTSDEWAGSFYPLVITTPDGSSNDNSVLSTVNTRNFAYQTIC